MDSVILQKEPDEIIEVVGIGNTSSTHTEIIIKNKSHKQLAKIIVTHSGDTIELFDGNYKCYFKRENGVHT